MKIYSRIYGRVLLLGLILVAMSCELTMPPDPFELRNVEDIIYTEHVQPIFDGYCTNCHAGTDAAMGLRLDSWDNVMAGSDFGEAVIPFDDDNSLMIKMVTRLVNGPHPIELSADTLLQPQIDFIRRWINLGARFDGPVGATIQNAGTVPNSEAQNLLFVPNQEDALISIIDIDAKLVIRTIDLIDSDVGNFNFTPNARPNDIEVEPDGSAIYVSLTGDNAVIKISMSNSILTGGLVGQAPFQTPGMLGLNPQTDQLFVGRSLLAVSPPRSIGEVSRSDMSIREIEVTNPHPHALAVDPSGEYAHTASLVDNFVITLDTASEDVTFTFLNAPSNSLVHFGISVDGTRLAATGQEANQLLIVDSSAPPTVERIGSFEVGNRPWHPVWTPDGNRVYVGNKGDNTVTVLNMENINSAEFIQTISGNGLADPHGSAVSPDGAYVFISNQNTSGAYQPRYDFGNNEHTGTVVVINTATNEIEKIIEVGRAPAGLSTILP